MQSNKSFFCEIAFLAVLNFFPGQKLIFGHFWNCKKMEFGKRFFVKLIYLISWILFAWTFLNFLARCEQWRSIIYAYSYVIVLPLREDTTFSFEKIWKEIILVTIKSHLFKFLWIYSYKNAHYTDAQHIIKNHFRFHIPQANILKTHIENSMPWEWMFYILWFVVVKQILNSKEFMIHINVFRVKKKPFFRSLLRTAAFTTFL